MMMSDIAPVSPRESVENHPTARAPRISGELKSWTRRGCVATERHNSPGAYIPQISGLRNFRRIPRDRIMPTHDNP